MNGSYNNRAYSRLRIFAFCFIFDDFIERNNIFPFIYVEIFIFAYFKMSSSNETTVNVQNSFSIYSIYAEAGFSPSLVTLFSFKFFFSIFCSATNLDLAFITWKNQKSLSGSCNILIGISGFSNGLMAINSIFALLITASGQNFIPVLQCTYGQTIFLGAFFFSSGIALFIGIDRLLAVSAPFWYTNKEKETGKKAIYLFASLSFCAIYSIVFLAIAYRVSLSNPKGPVICALADPMMDKIFLVVLLLEFVSILTALCYLVIWMLMKLKKMANDQNGAIFKSLFLIILLEVIGWTTYYFIRTILTPIAKIFKLEPLEIWFVMNAYSCIPYIAVGIGPIILFKYNKEYRNAFRRQWIKKTNEIEIVGMTIKGKNKD